MLTLPIKHKSLRTAGEGGPPPYPPPPRAASTDLPSRERPHSCMHEHCCVRIMAQVHIKLWAVPECKFLKSELRP